MLLDAVKFEPLSHESNLCLDVMLQEEPVVLVSHNQTHIEVDLLAKTFILHEAFLDHENKTYNVSHNNDCC